MTKADTKVMGSLAMAILTKPIYNIQHSHKRKEERRYVPITDVVSRNSRLGHGAKRGSYTEVQTEAKYMGMRYKPSGSHGFWVIEADFDLGPDYQGLFTSANLARQAIESYWKSNGGFRLEK